MDLIISYKSRFRLWLVWIFLVVTLFSTLANSWRVSQKCPHGHYFNDGCTACWCDIRTGQTKCEKLLQCSRLTDKVKCPRGRSYKDACGNDCTCYEASGAVLCNEIRRCPEEMAVKVHVPIQPSSLNTNVLLRRGGIAAPYIPPIEEHPIQLGFPSSTASPPLWSPFLSSTMSTPGGNSELYENIAIASTPHPHVRIPTGVKSEELIIEPAIIIRKKGSNKASIVRNPSSATSVTLPSSRHRNRDHTIILNNIGNDKLQDGAYSTSSSKLASLAPLNLYEKQLQTIMNIRRAYSQLLRSKVNFNFQLATGKVPTPPAANGVHSTTDHPRRFDSSYDNTTIFMNTTPSPPIFMTSQQPKPPPNINIKPFQPLVWRKEIKNVLKQFSPVPPLKHLVSYVSTSTENYLRDFLNNHPLQQSVQVLPSHQTTTTTTTTTPPPPPPPPPQPPTFPPRTMFPSSPTYPFQPFTTIEPFHEQQRDPSTIPIHEVYQQHDFKPLSNSYVHKTLNYRPEGSRPFDRYNHDNPKPKQEQFPFMNELMREIARIDDTPTSTPKSTLTAFPTFHTPGPPYAEIEEVQPLSFLPPPQPEPATPTRRTYMTGQEGRYPQLKYQQPVQAHPTVRVNLDKPIYINTPPQQRYPPPPKQFQYSSPQQRFPPPPPQPVQHQQQQTNRRVYTIPHRPHAYAPPPLQQHHHHAVHPMQRHPNSPQHNIHYRPMFPQYFIPRPKQYRLVLKGPVREAAVRMDDVVPRFVSKIAHEFFKKPEIYVPKIRPGKPLTLEKVVLNHREIVPTEMTFSPTHGAPPTKLRFTPQAQWEMKEELAKQGIMLNEPLINSRRDYVPNDPNVMEMDAPMKAVQTWETHSSMGMGVLTDDYTRGGTVAPPLNIPQIIQQAATQQNQHVYNPILLPSPTPSQMAPPPPTLDHQHQQELQHQLLLAQLHQQQQHQQIVSGASNDNFRIDPGEFNDFKHDSESDQHSLPPELQIPGVEQVIVDKYLVHDPMDMSGPLKMYSTTTIQPPTINTNMDISSMLLEHHRNGLAALPAHGPTPPPAVLVRHHGAPSPTTPAPSPTQTPMVPSPYPMENLFVTVINSTPQPFVSTTILPINNSPSLQNPYPNNGAMVQPGTNSGLVSQIQDFLAEEMDFGARPQPNLYEMLFQHRGGEIATDDHNGNQDMQDDRPREEEAEAIENQDHHDDEDQVDTETLKASGENTHVDTDKLANIFSMDYKSKYNRKPPAVIVIKVPPDHSDGPFPKVVEKRRGEGLEALGGRVSTKSKFASGERTFVDDNDSFETSTESSNVTPKSSKKSATSSESSGDDVNDSSSGRNDSSSAKRRRGKKNRKRKRRRRKKKNRNKSKIDEEDARGGDSGDVEDKELNSNRGNNMGHDKTLRRINEENEREDKNSKMAAETTTMKTTTMKTTTMKTTTMKTTTMKTTDENIQDAAAEKFNAELDWKSQLMANICDLNPSSPLCLTYRSICLLMTSED